MNDAVTVLNQVSGNKDCNLRAKPKYHISQQIQYRSRIGLFLAENVFSPTLLRRFSIVLVEGDDKLFWFAQVLHSVHTGSIEVKDDQQRFVFVKYFEVSLQRKNYRDP